MIISRKTNSESPVLRLDQLPFRRMAWVDRVEWDLLSPTEAQRLRELGICEGAGVEALHRGGWMGRGPLACRVGRMTIAMRAAHAAAIHVRDTPAAEPAVAEAAE